MANYSKLDGYVFDRQSNVGWGLTLKMPSKAPAVAKRIFDTLAHAQEYIDDVKDTAIEGLVLSVVADTDTALNGAYFVQSVGKKSDVEGGENINGVLVKLGSEDYIRNNTKTYSITSATTEGLGTNVREAYKLVDEDGVQAGEPIKIYKDSALQSVELVSEKLAVGEENQDGYVPSKQGQFLKFIYLTTSGENNVVYLDVSSFLAESEFKNGLSVNSNGEVSVKVDEKSETFLTVGEGGIKLSGVQSAINKAKTDLIGTADTGYDTLGRLQGKITSEAATRASTDEHIIQRLNTIQSEEPVYNSISKALVDAKAYTDTKITDLDAEKTSTGGSHVTVKVTEVDGVITAVNVTESDIASATGLTAEINRAKAAEKLNADAIAILNGNKTVDGSVAKALQDAIDYTDNETRELLDALSAEINEKSNIPVNVTDLFTEGNSMTGYTLSNLSKKNLYHDNDNTVKFVGYGDSAINPTTNEANLVMESFKDGIRTITIAYIKQNGSTITTQSVKTYSSNAFIMKISQSDYDTMKNAGTLDANTLYVIS